MYAVENKKIVLFDGLCNLCNGAIQFIIKHDKDDSFRFAPLQSKIGTRLTSERNIDTSQVDSIILIEPGVAYYTQSDAVLQIGKTLKNYRIISTILNVFPLGFRNLIYNFIARNRYKWYGKKEACMVPTPELQAKFLQ